MATRTAPGLRQIGSVPLDGTPYGTAYDDVRDRLWVTLTTRNLAVSGQVGGHSSRRTVARWQ